MIRLIFVALFVVLFLIIGIPVLGIEWLIGKVSKKTMDYSSLRLVQWAFNMIIKLAGIELTAIGEENISEGPVLYIGNHRSYFDIVITYARCKNLTGYIAKKEMLSIPLLRTWMKRLYCLFLDRENPKEGLKTILQAIDYVKHGISICIFPEGTRNKDAEHPDTLLPFKEGSFKIAQKTKCPIVPMVLTGTADVFENHFPWVKSTKVTLTYGKPIYVSELSKENQKRLGSYCEKIIQDMLNQELASQTK